MAGSSSKTVVYAATAGNLLVAATKFIAAWYTGSSAMLSEAIHSLVDTGNQLLLLYGMHRSVRPPDDLHPLGYGRELYFWSFVVAMLMFTLGAGAAFYEGVHHLLHPRDISDPLVSYIVLGWAALFEGSTWVIALREFRKAKGNVGYFEAVRRSKDPRPSSCCSRTRRPCSAWCSPSPASSGPSGFRCRGSTAPPRSASACYSA